MPHMPDLFREAEEAVFGRRHIVPMSEGGTNTVSNLAPEPPAAVPATMAPATADAATQQEETVSVITDIEEGYAAAKADLAKVEAALPNVLSKAKKLEGNPLADLAVKAAESILPPEAVAIINNTASKVFDELVSLYSAPQTAAAAQDPTQQAVAAAQ